MTLPRGGPTPSPGGHHRWHCGCLILLCPGLRARFCRWGKRWTSCVHFLWVQWCIAGGEVTSDMCFLCFRLRWINLLEQNRLLCDKHYLLFFQNEDEISSQITSEHFLNHQSYFRIILVIGFNVWIRNTPIIIKRKLLLRSIHKMHVLTYFTP